MSHPSDLQAFIGRAPETLPLADRIALVGTVVALEIYTPQNLALRRIEAIGDTPAECVGQLRSRGLDPAGFEFVRLRHPF